MCRAILLGLCVTLTSHAAAPPMPRVDLHGDPLPPGAIARLGTVRFRHPGSVYEAAFSSDGKLIAATNDYDDRIVLWERATGRKLREIVFPGNTPVLKLRFSSDGKRLYGRSVHLGESTFHVWEVATAEEVKEIGPLPTESTLLGYASNGDEWLLHRAGDLIRWDIAKGKEVVRHRGPTDPVLALALVGKRLVAASVGPNRVTLSEWGAKKPLWQLVASRDPALPKWPVGFSDDGRLFAIENDLKRISVVETLTGKVVCEIQAERGKPFGALRISPDGKTLVASNQDGSVGLWDLPSGKQRAQLVSVEGMPWNFAFSPDSKTLITGGPNNGHGVQMWDMATGKRMEPFPGHLSAVSAMVYAPDGRTIATISSPRRDPVVRLWNPETGDLVKTLAHPDGHQVSAIAFSPDGKRLATADWKNLGLSHIRIWDLETNRLRQAFAAHSSPCTAVAFSPDGKWLVSGASGSGGGKVYRGGLSIWDAQTGKRVRESEEVPGAVQSILFTRDGDSIFASANGVHFYDRSSGERMGQPFYEGGVRHLSLSQDGRLLITGASMGPAGLWEVYTHRPIPLELPRSSGQAVALAPDMRTLAYRGMQGETVLLDWPTGNELRRFATKGDFGLFAFSPDGRRLATISGNDSFAIIFDVSEIVNRPLPESTKPTAANLKSWWDELRSDDAGVAQKAVWQFHAAKGESLPFLAKMLQPVRQMGAETLAQLIADLDDETFEKRDNATRRLEALGDDIREELRKARAASDSLEQKKRLDRLLAKLTGFGPSPETMRGIRAVAALERIGGPEACKILQTLTKGDSSHPLTQEAAASLARLRAAGR